MKEHETTYPSNEKLTASTSIKVENTTDTAVTIENWTCGFGFLIDTVNLRPHSEGRVWAEYVWYDFRAKDMHNQVIASLKGVYYNRKVVLSQSADGTYHLSAERNIPTKKILVIVNKNWETEPVLNALTHPKLRPAALPFPDTVNTPRDGDNRMSEPRAVFTLRKQGSKPLTVVVVVRCIEDLMATGVNTSSSLEKYKVLPAVIAADAADLIISVSTANYPDPDHTHNGTVVLGGNFFIHDGNPASHDDPANNLIDDRIGTFIASNVAPSLFALAAVVNARLHCYPDGDTPNAVSKLIPPPNSPAPQLICEGAATFTAVGSVNVTDYGSYDTIDAQALAEFATVAPPGYTANSIETTHGVVKISSRNEPILFLSPITDRLNHFNDDVTDTQNYVSAFNGGLALGELLCAVAEEWGD